MKNIFYQLNEIADNYVTGDATQKSIQVKKLFEIIYFNIRAFNLILTEDERSDFLLWLHPKFESFLKRYNKEKALFSTFMRMNLKYYYSNFVHEKHLKLSLAAVAQVEENYSVSSKLYEMYEDDKFEYYAADTHAVYSAKQKEQPLNTKNVFESVFKKLGNNSYKKQLFLLACKTCFFITDDLVHAVAKKIGLEFECLYKIINALKAKNQKITDSIKQKIDARNKYYILKKSCEYRMSCEELSAYEKEKAEKTFDKNGKRFIQALLKNKKQHKMPSNRFIASMLSISRGTVDTNLAKILKTSYSEKHEDILSVG